MRDLLAELGPIDVYLFDQLLRRRIVPGMRVLDAGCGGGRNLVYFLRQGYDLWGLDPDPGAIDAVRGLAAELAPDLPAERLRVEAVESSALPDAVADVVIANALLHFAPDDAAFRAMLDGCWRLVAPGGLFFSRLASTIGVEDAVRPLGGRRFHLPDGSDRYLVDEAQLAALEQDLGATRLDPLKTTVVERLRAMTTWVLGKPA